MGAIIYLWNSLSLPVGTFVVFLVLIPLVSLVRLLVTEYRRREILYKIPGPPRGWPILGHLHLFKRPGYALTEIVYKVIHEMAATYGQEKGIFHFALGPQEIVCVCGPETIEAVLSSRVNITKAQQYDFVHEWLGLGLLTSTGDKWRSRRKLLTPAFHFDILKDFLPVFNEQSAVFVRKLRRMISDTRETSENGNAIEIDVASEIAALTMDIITETAMGVKMGAQSNPKLDYFKAVNFMGEMLMSRAYELHKRIDWIFRLTPMGRQYTEALRMVHDYVLNVIHRRKAEILSERKDNGNKSMTSTPVDDSIGRPRKRRLAFLDLLLEHHLADDKNFTLKDVQEETDTFMFEGHDTTAVSITWTLFSLGHNPAIQEKIFLELTDVFGEDLDREVTVEDLRRLRFLEAVIKESLRLHPSVPFIGRTTSVDSVLAGYDVPAGSLIFILIDPLHKSEKVFLNPHKFDPTRFLSTEAIAADEDGDNMKPLKRSFSGPQASPSHPYAYVPFSAGPRGCIGQRFALMEEKIILSYFFRHFRVRTKTSEEEIRIGAEMLLRPRGPVMIEIISRH